MSINSSMITISQSARAKILDLLAEENNPDVFVRAFVQGGGCSGFSYGFTFDQQPGEDDHEFLLGSGRIMIDSMSMAYLEGAEIDYSEGLLESGFTVRNPNAVTTCGCGSSFSV